MRAKPKSGVMSKSGRTPIRSTRSWQDYLKERAFHKKFGITRQQAGIKPS
jgi:hypothetical protein